MTDTPTPVPPHDPKDKKPISMISIVIWCVVGGIGVYYIVTGIMTGIANN